VDEVRDLIRRGIKEITLLGQNVNAYGKDLNNGILFNDLLKELNVIPELSRIRFTTSHPRDFNDNMVAAMADLKSVCEHIHLPLQSGSDRILAAMNRGYTSLEYMDKLQRLREKIPNVGVTTDIIVGFPGETQADFEDTQRALQMIRFDQIFSFKFSRRPGTAAREFPDQVPEEIKMERLSAVHRIQDEITLQHHKNAEGAIEEVLIEGIKNGNGQPFGRTRTNKIVNIEGSERIREGDLLKVRIVRGLKHSLLGSLIN
jgi:tRNA-2-methylthio-N6-dimethylallyladenosine synthase